MLNKTNYNKVDSDSSQELSNCVGNNVSVPKFSWFKSMSQIVGLTAVWHQDKIEGSPVGANTAHIAKQTVPQFIQSSISFYETIKLRCDNLI